MLTNQKRDYFFLMSTFTKPVMGFSPLAFGRLGPVVASRLRLVVGSQLLAMSLSCASTTLRTLAASAYVIFGIFGLTAKQPLLSTTLFVHLPGKRPYSSSVHFTQLLYCTVLYSCVVGTTLHYCIEMCRTICFLLVQPTQHYWHAINPTLPARYLLLRDRYYYAPIPYITNSLFAL